MPALSKTQVVEPTTASSLSASDIRDHAVQKRVLTTAEAARYLQLSVTYLNKMRVTGSGPVFVKLGRSVRYRQADLDVWVAARCFVSTSAAQLSGKAA